MMGQKRPVFSQRLYMCRLESRTRPKVLTSTAVLQCFGRFLALVLQKDFWWVSGLGLMLEHG